MLGELVNRVGREDLAKSNFEKNDHSDRQNCGGSRLGVNVYNIVDRGEVEKRTATLALVDHGRIRWSTAKMHRDWSLDLRCHTNVAGGRVPGSQSFFVVPDWIVCLLYSVYSRWFFAPNLIADLPSSNGNSDFGFIVWYDRNGRIHRRRDLGIRMFALRTRSRGRSEQTRKVPVTARSKTPQIAPHN